MLTKPLIIFTLSIFTLLLNLTPKALAQNVNYHAGQVQSHGTQKTIGTICREPLNEFGSCPKLRFVLMEGALVSPLGEDFQTESFIQNLDVTLSNFDLARGLTEKQAQVLRQNLDVTFSKNSNLQDISKEDFLILKDFAENHLQFVTSTAQSVTKGRESQVFSSVRNKTTKAYLYLRCADPSCTRIIAVENQSGVEAVINTFNRSSLSTVHFSADPFSASAKVYHTVHDLTYGKDGKHGMYGRWDSDQDHGLGWQIFLSLTGTYSGAYAVAVTGITIAGTVTAIVTSPIKLIKNIFAPSHKLEKFKAGSSVDIGLSYYSSLLEQIRALK